MPEKYLEAAVMRKIDFRQSGSLKNVLFPLVLVREISNYLFQSMVSYLLGASSLRMEIKTP